MERKSEELDRLIDEINRLDQEIPTKMKEVFRWWQWQVTLATLPYFLGGSSAKEKTLIYLAELVQRFGICLLEDAQC